MTAEARCANLLDAATTLLRESRRAAARMTETRETQAARLALVCMEAAEALLAEAQFEAMAVAVTTTDHKTNEEEQ